MLYEIYCEEFHQKKIKFNENLNVVLGTDKGHNSIGKSTFLLVIDFVFGGDTYSKASDIINNIGSHDIFFTFQFNSKFYKFCRNNTKSTEVWECDGDYKRIKSMSIRDFRNWLDCMYNMQLPDLSFRDAVGRYIRVYGKGNCDEKRPLNRLPQEKSLDSILALLKLFDAYLPIKMAKEQADKVTEKLQVFNKAQNLELIGKISKNEYNQNVKRLEIIREELKKFEDVLENQIVGVDLSVSKEALDYKNLLSNARRAQGNLKTKYNVISNNQEYKFPLTSATYTELNKYFPNVELNNIANVEKFHNAIAGIFKNELTEEKNKLQQDIQEYDAKISYYEDKLRKLLNNMDIPKKILQQHANLLKELNTIQKQNDAYEKSSELKEDKKDCVEILNALKNKQFSTIGNEINAKMRLYNDHIYGGTCHSPILTFTKNNYNFYTPDDTGTGIAYKGLIVFDLAVLSLTKLPLIVHDSLILKQIYDSAIEKILELYIQTHKQVIIAFDKQSSYTSETQRILNENTVLKLAAGGEELFGRSWG